MTFTIPKPALTVYKAVIGPHLKEFLAPRGAEILTAREQGDDICVWFRCDPGAPIEKRRIEVCATGHKAPSGRYIGSAHLSGGALVFHVFEPA